MKRFLIMALAVTAAAAWSCSEAQAQTYQNSYKFGLGFNSGIRFPYPGNGHSGFHGQHRFRGFPGLGFGFGHIGVLERTERPPHFALHPPVYYNGIVSRPYGVSPFAAPPGIYPVEMATPTPLSIKNPYIERQATPVSEDKAEAPPVSADNKTTHLYNPYIESITAK